MGSPRKQSVLLNSTLMKKFFLIFSSTLSPGFTTSSISTGGWAVGQLGSGNGLRAGDLVPCWAGWVCTVICNGLVCISSPSTVAVADFIISEPDFLGCKT